MENNLINLNLATLSEEAQAKADKLTALAVSPENCSSLEEIRAEANKEIKAVKAQIELAKKAYLKPFAQLESQYLEALKPYEDATKAFSGAILEAKKTKRTAKLKEIYSAYIMEKVDGNGCLPMWLPTFDEATEGITLTTPEATAREIIQGRVANAEKKSYSVALSASKSAYDKIRSYAIALGAEWEEL